VPASRLIALARVTVIRRHGSIFLRPACAAAGTVPRRAPQRVYARDVSCGLRRCRLWHPRRGALSVCSVRRCARGHLGFVYDTWPRRTSRDGISLCRPERPPQVPHVLRLALITMVL